MTTARLCAAQAAPGRPPRRPRARRRSWPAPAAPPASTATPTAPSITTPTTTATPRRHQAGAGTSGGSTASRPITAPMRNTSSTWSANSTPKALCARAVQSMMQIAGANPLGPGRRLRQASSGPATVGMTSSATTPSSVSSGASYAQRSGHSAFRRLLSTAATGLLEQDHRTSERLVSLPGLAGPVHARRTPSMPYLARTTRPVPRRPSSPPSRSLRGRWELRASGRAGCCAPRSQGR